MSDNQLLTQFYKTVQFSIGFKVKGQDGSVLYRAYTALPMKWDSFKAGESIESQRNYAFPRLKDLHGEKFKELMGRELRASDLSVGFRPVEDELLTAVYIDDVSTSVPGHLMVETSTDSFHAHFLLNRPSTEEEAFAVLRALRDWYGGDPGAAKPRQVRRFVTEGISFQVNPDEPTVDVDWCVEHYPPVQKAPKLDLSPVALSDVQKMFFQDIWDRKLRSSRHDIDHPNGNFSDADFGLATYLLEHGYEPSVVKSAIISSRSGLSEKKGAWTEGYLEKTVENAVSAVNTKQVSQSAKKRFSL